MNESEKKSEENNTERETRSLTPCMDEKCLEDDNCADNSKEIELSDISDVSEWSAEECNNENVQNDQVPKESAFKKLTRSNRERNYRDNVRRRNDGNFYQNRQHIRRYDNSRRKEIERYNVRKVIANREFSISRSRSRSYSPQRQMRNVNIRPSFSPGREIYRQQSLSPISRQKRYSPVSPRNSSSSEQYRSHMAVRRSQTPEEIPRRSRSKHRHTKNRSSVDKLVKRKKHKSKDHQRKRKKSRSKSKRHSSPSLSPEPILRNHHHISPSRQIMNVSNPNLPQHENIKIILKNEDFTKRQKVKKRDKKSTRKDKLSRKETREKMSQKSLKDQQQLHPQTKEVFASGDNIVISVCFNNNTSNGNNNNNNNNNLSSKDSNTEHNKLKTSDTLQDDRLSTKAKTKKRLASPASLPSSNESFDKAERRQKKHKRKKIKPRKEKTSQTPPLNSGTTKRKNDAKPIAIIDLERSPGKEEVTQSPKEVIVLSDSDGENKKRDGGNKDIVIIEDTIIEKGRNHQSPMIREHHTPPESPPTVVTQPVLKFSLKSKSNILPFNLLHDQSEEVEEMANGNNAGANQTNEPQNNVNKTNSAQQEAIGGGVPEEKSMNNQNEAYDPFEPTKSGSTSPVTPPQPNDSNENSKNKLEGLNEKLQMSASKETGSASGMGSEQNQQSTSSLWNNRKEFEKKSQPITPPMPPTFAFSSSGAPMNKQHIPSLYDGIYGSDLKTPVVPSPIKSNIKPSHVENKNKDDDDEGMTPYSPSSDGYGGSNDYEPPTTSIHQNKSTFETLKHSDTQSSDPSGTYSFGNDEPPTKTTPLKLTASTLKSFNSTMRSSGPVGLQFVNKAELSIFENYLPASQQKSPLVKRQPNSSFLRSKMSRFTSSMNENGSPHRSMPYQEPLKPPIIDETILDDDVPSSAVDLANKDRFLKKSLRIERVAEEVKLVLKPHYNKKHITKEEYKEILRKAVPKICHNKTGEINIQKITQLIEAYIKKVRYKRKSVIASSI